MDGILPLWKEKGMTSFDCVYKVRKILKTKNKKGRNYKTKNINNCFQNIPQ